MARTPRTPRLGDIEPAEVALFCAKLLAGSVARALLQLSPEAARRAYDLDETPIYQDVLALATYAVEGRRFRGSLDTLLQRVGVLAESALEAGQLPRSLRPATPLSLVVAGAVAREALLSGEPLSTVDVAVLSGLDRDHVTALACQGDIPGAHRTGYADSDGRAPWRFRNTAALREWLAAREGES